MGNAWLYNSPCEKDLGVFVDNKLNMSQDRVCGRRPVAISHGNLLYRLKGTDALPGTWPWAVSFQFLTRKGYRHFCTGALISSQWVISAAHCFQIKKYIQTEYWRVLIGATIQSKPGVDAQARSIKRLVQHQNYKHSGHNDIALVELDQPVICNDFIQPACLPDEHINIQALTHCYVGGWGVLDRSKTIKYTDILQESKVSLISNDNCNSYGWNKTKIKDDNICAVGESQSVDRCQGDGGSPLMCRPPRSERFWVIGINSWGTNCLYKHRPGVFSSTKFFSLWINRVVRQPPKVALVPPFKTTTRSQKKSPWESKPYLVYYQDELGNGFTFYFLGPTPPHATVLYLTKTPPSWSELDLTIPRTTSASPFLSRSRSRPTLAWASAVTYPPYINTAGQKEWRPTKSLVWRRHHGHDHGHRWRRTQATTTTTTKEKRRRLVKYWTSKWSGTD
ncbi:acrosin-like [Anolis sagrei]|uniref:acrosin-like n=1 Tax=Anolis sagrei TaxID=38937 RepID=UPI00352217B7